MYIRMKRWFYMPLGNCTHVFCRYFGPHQYSANQLWLYDAFRVKATKKAYFAHFLCASSCIANYGIQANFRTKRHFVNSANKIILFSVQAQSSFKNIKQQRPALPAERIVNKNGLLWHLMESRPGRPKIALAVVFFNKDIRTRLAINYY